MTKQPTVLVTGGAGYIGEETCRALHAVGMRPVTLDDLSTGKRARVKWGPLVESSISPRSMRIAVDTYRPVAVIHLAAPCSVEQSFDQSDLYVEGQIESARCINSFGLPTVFASTAAVSGESSPYAAGKAAAELIFRQRNIVLRYHNVAGGMHESETHLIPCLINAVRRGTTFTQYGNATRDYVHVRDVARANVLAVQAALRGRRGFTIEICTGRGTMTSQAIDLVRRVSGVRPEIVLKEPRRGDSASLIGDPRPALATIGWTPMQDVYSIVEDAWWCTGMNS